MITKVCKHCGSDDVLIDASAEWSVEKQDWVLRDIYDQDKGFCCDCDGDTRIVDKDTGV